MIPERVIEVLCGGAFMQIGTRDATLRPAHTFAIGGRVDDDRRTVTVFVPTACSEPVLRNLATSPRIALGISLATHEAYQIKGSYLSSRPADEEDLAVQESARAALLDGCLAAGFPEELSRPMTQGFAYTPAVAITFHAEEVFLQTPGPEAGTSMV